MYQVLNLGPGGCCGCSELVQRFLTPEESSCSGNRQFKVICLEVQKRGLFKLVDSTKLYVILD